MTEADKVIGDNLHQVEIRILSAIERERSARSERGLGGDNTPCTIYVNIPHFGEKTSRAILRKYATGDGVTGEGMHGTFQFPAGNIEGPGDDYDFFILCTELELEVTTKPMMDPLVYEKTCQEPELVLKLSDL